MITRYERMIATRYLLPGRGEGFIFLVASISLVAVALGVAALIAVMSVMNGFRAELFDRILGLNGHAVVQGYGAPGAAPWPGQLDKTNPVDVVVAWDGLLRPEGGLIGGAFQGGGLGNLMDRLGLADPIFRVAIERGLPAFGIRVPSTASSLRQ